MKNELRHAFWALLFMACASCSQNSTPEPVKNDLTGSVEERKMVLSEQDSGSTVKIGVGEVIAIRLKENPTTGYRWSVESNSGLEQISDQFEASEVIGAAGVRMFQFRTTNVGLYEIRLKNWREWEGEGSVTDSFVATLNVK